MPKDNENVLLSFVGPVAPSEPQGFAAEAMIRCEECLRANPPTRVSCLYCAAALPLTEVSQRLRKPTLRQPEKHQRGYNNIILPQEQKLSSEALAETADLLQLDPVCLDRIITGNRPLPVARTGSSEEAQLVQERLLGLGLRALTLNDDDLGLSETCISRIRLMRFDEAGLTMQHSNNAEPVVVDWSKVLLVVSGRIFVKRVELDERKSRRAEKEIVRSTQYFTDEAVADIYAATTTQTWRVAANSFDFSCLGEEKTLLVNENFTRLIKLICAGASNARLDDSYGASRQSLDPIWRSEQETESKGWRREGTGKYSLGAATTNSNETQFTRYSRLSYYFARQAAV